MRDCWVGVLIIQIYKCLGITKSQFVYKKMYLLLVVIQEGDMTKENMVNTDNTPVPKQGRSQINLK